jgi:ABC-2 type transport system permease protein
LPAVTPEASASERSSDATPFRLLLQVNGLSMLRKALAIRQRSRLWAGVIGVFLVGYAVMAYLLFFQGLSFLNRFPGLGGLLVERLLFLLFACLFGLLLLSNLVISYSNFFRNREADFLLPLPIAPETIFRWKFIESVMLASWAFLFLIAPLLLAYGRVHRVDWHFYPMIGFLVALFIVLPGVAGSWFALLLARHLDRRLFQAVLVGGVTLVVGLFFWRTQPTAVTEEMLLENRVLVVIDRLLDNTRLVQFPFLPSYWLGSAVQQWMEGAFRGAVFYGAVLLSHTLFFGLLAMTRFGSVLYEAMSCVRSRGSILGNWAGVLGLRRSGSTAPAAARSLLERCVEAIPGLPRDVGSILVKDIRVFWRDTTQWGQTLMLFGLLTVYLMNLRHFTRQSDSAFWVSLTSFLNLGACALNLATLTTRFVFPQFSLEGRRVWLMGLAPLGLSRVVWWKFLTASVLTGILTLGLTLLSCRMLHLDAAHTAFFSVAITVMTLVLNALSVGLGTLYPNFAETNPGKIVSGFGGTFCLVLSFVYILGSVLLLALGSPWGWHGEDPQAWRALPTGVTFVLGSLLIGGIPLRLALRRAATMEL